MFRNRRDRQNSIEGNAFIPKGGPLWLAALRSLLFNIIYFPTFAILLIINIPALLGRNPPYYVGPLVGRYSLWLVKVICGLDYRVEGLENVPQGPCVLASKHQSAWDTFIFLVFFPSIAYVSKIELERIPVYGWYIKKHRNISIDRKRGRKAMNDLRTQAKERIDENRKIILFPEGSRTAPGVRGEYQKGVQALYKDLSCPFIPVALNSGVYWGRRSWIKYPGVITIRFLKPLPKDLSSAEFMEQMEEQIETASNQLLSIA